MQTLNQSKWLIVKCVISCIIMAVIGFWSASPNSKAVQIQAMHGDTEAQMIIANDAFQGGDMAKAAKWYLRAVKKTNAADVQNTLGVIYQKGLNGKPDYLKAREWYQHAAKQG